MAYFSMGIREKQQIRPACAENAAIPDRFDNLWIVLYTFAGALMLQGKADNAQ